MGTARGHTRQSSLETRLALIAAAPWKSTRTAQLPGVHGQTSPDDGGRAEAQATALLNFAWGFVFEAPGGTLHFLDIRHAPTYTSVIMSMPFALLGDLVHFNKIVHVGSYEGT